MPEPVRSLDRELDQARDVAAAARARARSERTTVVAVDGPGGSGKTTLAAAVAELLDGAPVVHGDDFYRPMPERDREELDAQQGYHRYFDWQRLRDQVLEPLRAGRPAHYQRFDWEAGELADWHELSPSLVVIVEGVYSGRPELASYYDLTTYVDTPREVCLRRLRARNQDTEGWITRWRAAEDFYLRTTQPQARADLIVQGH